MSCYQYVEEVAVITLKASCKIDYEICRRGKISH